MADFVQTSVSKSALRTLRNPIATLGAFDSIISAIVATNPWGCVPYTRAGEAMPGVAISTQSYTAKVRYQDNMGKVIGEVTVKSPTQAGFTTAVNNVKANTALEAAIGGTAVHDAFTDRYSATLRCNDPTGDIYSVAFTRTTVRVTSYVEDSLLATIEAWADGISALS